MIQDDQSPEKALRFKNLYSRLVSQPVLSQKWAILHLLHQLSDSPDPEAITSQTSSRAFDAESLASRKTRRRSGAESQVFNEAFATAGLPKVSSLLEPRLQERSTTQRTLRQTVAEVRARASEASPPETPPSGTPSKPRQMDPPESALLRDLPFILQGVSSTNLSFTSQSALLLPRSLPIPVISLLHTLAEPSLLYRSLSSFADGCSGALVEQSLRSAISVELRSYLSLIATLESQIRRALSQLDPSLPRQGIGKTGVTLKRCVIWTRDATLGLRLMSMMVEQSTTVKGGALISSIHSFAITHGDPFVTTFAERLLASITRPFYDMLSQWIYDGELSDPYGEFFVSENPTPSDVDDPRKPGAISVWTSKYSMNEAMIPSIISDDFANRVFLIGKVSTSFAMDATMAPGSTATRRSNRNASLTAIQLP